MNRAPVGILLAAGQSRRFGSNKLLHPIVDGTPMLLASAQTLAGVLPGTIIVINRELADYTPQLEQLGMQVVVNAQAEQGMGSSIACGVRASEAAAGWLVALADMPYLRRDTIRQLANRLEHGTAIVAPLYKQQRGHPVGFGRRYKDALLALQEDVGARHVITRHRDRLELVPTTDVGVVTDIDRVKDFR